jgi:hypothetical protein
MIEVLSLEGVQPTPLEKIVNHLFQFFPRKDISPSLRTRGVGINE